MSTKPLYSKKVVDTTKSFTGTIRMNDHDFNYEYYLLPIIGENTNEVNEQLIKRLGNRIQNGKKCLDIDEDLVRTNIENNEYAAIAFVENKNHDDVASGTLQYYDWCENGRRQLWINDLCRITSQKQDTSPIKVLLQVFEIIAKKHKKTNKSLYLMVDKEDAKEADILTQIYTKYGYHVVDEEHCPVEGYTVMEKGITKRSLTKKGGRGKERKTRRR
jgi:hypothetical protein